MVLNVDVVRWGAATVLAGSADGEAKLWRLRRESLWVGAGCPARVHVCHCIGSQVATHRDILVEEDRVLISLHAAG